MRTVRAVFMNLAVTYCLLAWVFADQQWAENIYKFLLWVSFFVMLIVAFVDDLKQKARDRGRSLNKNTSHAIDVFSIIILVGWGSVFYGSLLLLQALFQAAIYDSDIEEKETATHTTHT